MRRFSMKKATKLLLLIITIILPLSIVYKAEKYLQENEYAYYQRFGVTEERFLSFKENLESGLKITKIDSTIETLDEKDTNATDEEYDETHTSMIISSDYYMLPIMGEQNPQDIFNDVLYSNSNKVLTYDKYKSICKKLLIEQTYFNEDWSYIILSSQTEYPDTMIDNSNPIKYFIDFKLFDIKYDKETNKIIIYIKAEYEEMHTRSETFSIKIIPIYNESKLENSTSIEIIDIGKEGGV